MAKAFAVVAACAVISAGAAAPLQAQTSTRIAGVVRDETGAGIRGAIVHAEIVLNAALPTAMTSATDDRGRFLFLVAKSGGWKLNFEAPGFDSQTLMLNVRLAGPPPNLEIKLERHEAPESTGAMAGVDAKALAAQLAAAATMFDDGRYDQAITAYRDIRTKTPALTLVNLQLGNAYLAKKSFPEAEAAFGELLKADAESATGMMAMGTLKEAQGNTSDATSWYQKASTADSFWTRPLMKLAALARKAGDVGTAGRYLTRVIDLDPGSQDAAEAQTMQRQLR